MKDIETLIELQKIDVQIFDLKANLEKMPQEITALEEEFLQRESFLKKSIEDLKQVQVGQKEKELELQTKEQAVERQQLQLYQVKSNKEYNALQLEIGKIKADNSLLEEQILMGMEKVDKMKQSVAEEKQKLELGKKELDQKKNEIEIQMRQLREQLDSLAAQRKRIIESSVKPEILALYERILENRGELAIVSVKENSCSGCFMAIRPQVVNELRLGKLLTCDNCSRILYVESYE